MSVLRIIYENGVKYVRFKQFRIYLKTYYVIRSTIQILDEFLQYDIKLPACYFELHHYNPLLDKNQRKCKKIAKLDSLRL